MDYEEILEAITEILGEKEIERIREEQQQQWLDGLQTAPEWQSISSQLNEIYKYKVKELEDSDIQNVYQLLTLSSDHLEDLANTAFTIEMAEESPVLRCIIKS